MKKLLLPLLVLVCMGGALPPVYSYETDDEEAVRHQRSLTKHIDEVVSAKQIGVSLEIVGHDFENRDDPEKVARAIGHVLSSFSNINEASDFFGALYDAVYFKQSMFVTAISASLKDIQKQGYGTAKVQREATFRTVMDKCNDKRHVFVLKMIHADKVVSFGLFSSVGSGLLTESNLTAKGFLIWAPCP